jgi:formyl-CoA transferase
MRPSFGPDQLVDDPHLRESGGVAPMQTEDGGVTQVVLLPLLMDGRRPGVRQPLAGVGEHTEEVLGGIRSKKKAGEAGLG